MAFTPTVTISLSEYKELIINKKTLESEQRFLELIQDGADLDTTITRQELMEFARKCQSLLVEIEEWETK